jgi:hypothetical protein
MPKSPFIPPFAAFAVNRIPASKTLRRIKHDAAGTVKIPF